MFLPWEHRQVWILIWKKIPPIWVSLNSCPPLLIHCWIMWIRHFQNLLCFIIFFSFQPHYPCSGLHAFLYDDNDGFLTDLFASFFSLLRSVSLSAAGLIFLNQFPDATQLSAQRFYGVLSPTAEGIKPEARYWSCSPRKNAFTQTNFSAPLVTQFQRLGTIRQTLTQA